MVKNYNPHKAADVYELSRFYKRQNSSTAYLLPMLDLSCFDFTGFLVNTFISLTDYKLYVKCTNPMYSLSDHIYLDHSFRATNDDETEVYYYLEFSIPEDYHKYYDFFLENKLNQFDPISIDILRKNKLMVMNQGNAEYSTFPNTTVENKKKNKVIQEVIYNLWYNIFETEEGVYKYPLFGIRWEQIKDLNVMTKKEFMKKVLDKEIDLSQKIDFNLLDIEKELNKFKHVSKYNPEGVFIYE